MDVFFGWLQALQGTEIPTALRGSYWAYPLVNATHILGFALLVGAIVPLDLRLIGFWPSVPIKSLARILLPVAIAGLTVAIIAGAVLFSVSATKYAGTRVFQLKLALFAAAAMNAILLHRAATWELAMAGGDGLPPMRFRVAAILSIGLWVAVLVCGRMIAYVE